MDISTSRLYDTAVLLLPHLLLAMVPHVCRHSLDGFGLVEAKLQVAIKLLACLLEVVLVEATYILPLVRIMAETLTVAGLDILQVATAGEEGSARNWVKLAVT